MVPRFEKICSEKQAQPSHFLCVFLHIFCSPLNKL
nr:unnamed protein product [Callosobruchus chinensis]